jgi:hypothetical protein
MIIRDAKTHLGTAQVASRTRTYVGVAPRLRMAPTGAFEIGVSTARGLRVSVCCSVIGTESHIVGVLYTVMAVAAREIIRVPEVGLSEPPFLGAGLLLLVKVDIFSRTHLGSNVFGWSDRRIQ